MSNIFIINLIILLFINKFPFNICLDTMVVNKYFLEEHNKYRKMHGVPNLELDNQLIRLATAYAESLAKNPNNNYLVPSGNYYEGDEKLGENLFQCNKRSCTIENYTQPLTTWYKEMQFYNFNTNAGEKGTANFTQMVWKNTKKLGCGVALKTETNYKVVCYYLPEGNIPEKYDINVFPAQKINEEKNGLNNTNETSKVSNESNADNSYESYEDFITNNSFNLKFYFFFVYFLLIFYLK